MSVKLTVALLLLANVLSAQIPVPGSGGGGGGGGGGGNPPLSGAGLINGPCSLPSAVITPASGTVTVFCDSSNNNALGWKDATGSTSENWVTQALATMTNARMLNTSPEVTNPGGDVSPIFIDTTITDVAANQALLHTAIDIKGSTTLAGSSGGTWNLSDVNLAASYTIGTGNGAAIYAGLAFFDTVTVADDGSSMVGAQFSPLAAGTGQWVSQIGVQIDAGTGGSGTVANTISLRSYIDPFGSGVMTSAENQHIEFFPGGGGTVGTYYGSRYAWEDSGAAVTTLYGVEVDSPVGLYSAPTSEYGIYISDMGSAAGYYPIYQAGTTNHSSFEGTLAAGLISGRGAHPTVSGCSATIDTNSTNAAGDVTAGATSCTVAITFANSQAFAHSTSCHMQNITHPVAANQMFLSAVSASSATFTGTAVLNDILHYSCGAGGY